MDEATLKVTLNQAIEALIGHQPDIFTFTPETHVTEWTLAHHLANEVRRFFPDLHCDIEVVKPNYDNRRPDIIVHRRRTHEENFLVIEVKLDGTDGELERDAKKIRDYWFRAPLRYAFGAVVNLRIDGRHAVEVFKNV